MTAVLEQQQSTWTPRLARPARSARACRRRLLTPRTALRPRLACDHHGGLLVFPFFRPGKESENELCHMYIRDRE